MSVSLNEFLSAFYPDEQEPVWFLGFPAKKLPDGHADKGKQWKKQLNRQTLRTNKLLQDNLRHANESLGLYFVVNAGGTEKKDITRINAVFCEIDNAPMDAQHYLFDECPMRPSVRVETAKSVHAYWLLSDAMTVQDFGTVQHGLIDRFNADEKIINENRVMRLPHFNHLKWDGEYVRTRVTIHTFNPDVRYTAADLIAEFPYTPPPAPKYETQGFTDETWEGIANELRWRIRNHPTYRLEPNRVWGTAKGVCHDGNNNTALTLNNRTGAVSCKAGCDYTRILHAFGLEKPTKVAKIARIPAAPQTSELYQYLTQGV